MKRGRYFTIPQAIEAYPASSPSASSVGWWPSAASPSPTPAGGSFWPRPTSRRTSKETAASRPEAAAQPERPRTVGDSHAFQLVSSLIALYRQTTDPNTVVADYHRSAFSQIA